MPRSACAVMFLIVMSAVSASAAVPTQITVQGKVTDAGGTPLPAGAKTFTFSIFDTSAAGAQVWPVVGGEVQSITTSTEGLWVGMVGAVIPLTDSVFADTTRWLEINVDGTTLPRVRLATGPFAFRVATVDGATGGSVRGDVTVSGGNIKLDPSTALTGNIYKGVMPFLHNYGLDNTFVGVDAGNLTMTGIGNTASGSSALYSNTTGINNTASGIYALYSDTSGDNNTASGAYALYSHASGDGNTASGFAALQSSTTGYQNTASGSLALSNNTSGNGNTASGTQALLNNTSGFSNTAIGIGADVSTGDLTNATTIGAFAVVDASAIATIICD